MDLMSFRRESLVVLIAVVLLAGCGGPKVGDEVKQTITPTSSTIPGPTTLVPQNPDIAYFNEVLAKIEKVNGDVRREVTTTQSYSETTNQKLGDIFGAEHVKAVRTYWSDQSTKAHPQAKPVPGDDVDNVQAVIEFTGDCVLLELMNDQNNVLLKPQAPSGPWLYGLRVHVGPNGYNPTVWKIEYQDLKNDKTNSWSCR